MYCAWTFVQQGNLPLMIDWKKKHTFELFFTRTYNPRILYTVHSRHAVSLVVRGAVLCRGVDGGGGVVQEGVWALLHHGGDRDGGERR